eukprot:TRINITY_DN793_c0_g1_i1.p1 TRINITY_DN793_c0_g1~~TRINITY_DN793_c0_g1_i1.p1  ORF type:complete len:344 (+),score=107.48 TRINITY_DN793_c0_g1_i1:80-1111(+)
MTSSTVLKLLVLISVVVTAEQGISRNEAIKKFAPLIRLSESDTTRPSSVDDWLPTTTLHLPDGSKYTWEQVEAKGASWLAKVDKKSYFTSKNRDHVSGKPLERGQSTAPIYVHTITRENGDQDIQYWTFYPWNWCQYFKMRYLTLRGRKTKAFPWCDLAVHEGDWEMVQVRLTNDYSQIKEIFMSAHGKGEVLPASSFEFEGSHPIVYAAKHSHAHYHTPGFKHQFKFDIKLLNFQVGDQVDEKSVAWRTWAHQIVDMDVSPPSWVDFLGKWGFVDTELDDDPEGAPAAFHAAAKAAYEVVSHVEKLQEMMKLGEKTGPTGPKAKDLWTKDPIARIRQSEDDD